jgi:hypothetical protein
MSMRHAPRSASAKSFNAGSSCDCNSATFCPLSVAISAFNSAIFVPWAAFVQKIDGHKTVLEQKDIVNCLLEQSGDNPDEFNLENTIQQRKDTEEVSIKLPD